MVTKISTKWSKRFMLILVAISLLMAMVGVAQAAPTPQGKNPEPKFSAPAAFDVSPALRDMASSRRVTPSTREDREVRPERGPDVVDHGFTGDGALQEALTLQQTALSISAPMANFEGLSNLD